METKNNMKLWAILMVLGLAGMVGTVKAQNTSKTVYSTSSGESTGIGENDKWSLGLHFMYAKPMFQLEDNRYRNGGSFDLEVLSPSLLKKSSFFQFKLGGHIDYTGSGTEVLEIELLEPAGELADYRVRNQSVGLHLMGRLTTKEMAVMPYIDGIIGGRGLFSTNVISLQNESPDYETSTTDFLTSDITFIYGGSLGTLVKLGKNTFADFRVTYSQGSRADFVSLDHFDADLSTYPNFEHTIVERTRTPLLFFSAGVVFNITSSYGGEGYQNADSYRSNGGNSGNVYYGNRTTRRSNRNNNGCEPRRSTGAKKKIKLKTNTGKPKDKPKAKPAY